jgi:ABC-type transport system involved in multi-copper enzyme maturation permease subunit
MSSSTFTIASYAFKDAIKAKWLIIFAIVFFLLAINLPIIALHNAGYLPPNYLTLFIPDLIAFSFPFIPLLALPMGAPAIVEERESGTMQFVLSNPISKSQYLAGKYLGLLGATTLVVAGGFGISAVVTYGTDFGGYVQILPVIIVGATLNLIMLALALALSIEIRRKITALTAGIFVWFLFSVVSNYNLLGDTLATARQVNLAMALILLNPVQSAMTISLLKLTTDPGQLGISGLIALNVLGYTLSYEIISLSLIVWAAVLTGICFLLFRRQDAV